MGASALPLLEGGASWGSAPLLPEPEAPGVYTASLAGLPASLAAPAMELDWLREVRSGGGQLWEEAVPPPAAALWANAAC